MRMEFRERQLCLRNCLSLFVTKEAHPLSANTDLIGDHFPLKFNVTITFGNDEGNLERRSTFYLIISLDETSFIRGMYASHFILIEKILDFFYFF